MRKHYIIALWFSVAIWLTACLLSLVSCGNTHAKYIGTDFTGGDESSRAIQDFGGISNIYNVTDSTATIIWPYHMSTAFYVIFFRHSSNDDWQVSGVVVDRTTFEVTGLTLNSPYQFMVKAVNALGVMDTNNKAMAVRTKIAPNAPSAITLKFPSSYISFSRTPEYTIRGVKPGETVRLFKNDASCGAEAEVGRAVVEAGKTTVDIVSANLGLALAQYKFYANSTSTTGYVSACSVAFASYETVACPNNSYVPVEGNADLGTTAFCVMRTEARQGDGDIPVATYDGLPWVSINAINAKKACKRITVEGGTCDLISNPQWMAIARDIENTPENWSGGEVGVGMLNRGHSDNDPEEALTIDPNNAWCGTGQTSDTWSQKRTHMLSNGEMIWDLGGNVLEWVDWEIGSESFSVGPNTCPKAVSPYELYAMDCPALAPNDYLPGNPNGIEHNEYTSATYGIGRINGTSEGTRAEGGGGAATRGGYWNVGTSAGVFYLSFVYSPSNAGTYHGFRCVCLVGP